MSALAGHMMNPQEDLNLRGEDIQEWYDNWKYIKFYEKLDGFNVHILKHNGEIRVARGKNDLMNNGIGLEEINDRFPGEHARVNFRLAIELARPYADALVEFDGRYTYNCEIINGQLNLIKYDDQSLHVHGIKDWETGTEERVDIEGLTREPLKIERPNIFEYINSIRGLMGELTLGELYHQRFIQATGCQDKEVFSRLMNSKKLLKSQGVWEWVEKDWKNLRYNITKDIDGLFIRIGDIVKAYAENTKNILGQGIHDEWLEDAFELDPINTNRIVMSHMKIEGLVFECNGREYKFTGSFGPINQLYGKFNRIK